MISEELFPVVGAVVTIDGELAATTSSVGSFEVGGLEIGTHAVNITADGYEGLTEEFEVETPGLLEKRFQLTGIPGKSPFASTIIFTGMDACSLSAVYSAGPIGGPCPFGESDTTLKVEVGPDWTAGVHEMGWKSSENMIFASSVSTAERPDGAGCRTGTDHSWCPAMVWGYSPLRIYVRPDDAEYAAKYAIDQKETWPGGQNFTSYIFESYSGYAQQEINQTFYDQCVVVNNQFDVPASWGCPFGVGVSLGIRFDFYHTTFYLAAPTDLEGFTAMPDA